MQKWWTTLGLVAATLGVYATSASAQFGPPGGGMGPPPGGFGMPPGMMGGPPPGMMGGGGPPPGMMGAGGPPPGAFGGGAPMGGMPPDFPNAGKPSQEPVSPFAIKDEGMPNAFTDLNVPPRRPDPYALVTRVEYVGWRMSSGPTNAPLVSTTTNPAFGSFGQLGNGNTVILVDRGNTLDYSWSNGLRLTTGVAIGYLPPIELAALYVRRNATVFSGGSLPNPTEFLAIPFQDVQPAFIIPGTAGVGTETAAVISVPIGSPVGAFGGTLSVTSDLLLTGFEANVFCALNDNTDLRLDFFMGYRHLHLSENLQILTQAGGPGGGVTFNGIVQPGNIFTTSTTDNFGTVNNFDGGQLGLRGILNMGRWNLFSDVKLGLGATSQQLAINGSSSLIQTVPNRATQTTNGGILALPSNSKNLTRSMFSVVPEVNLALSFQCSQSVRFFGGYDIMYWTSVARPGDAISNTIDSRQIPTSVNFAGGLPYNGPFAPSQIPSRSFLAQGLFFGIEIGF